MPPRNEPAHSGKLCVNRSKKSSCLESGKGSINTEEGIMMKYFALLMLVSFSSISMSTELTGVSIDELHFNRGLGNKVFIRTSILPQNQGKITCHTDNNWNYVLPLANEVDRSIYATLLAALSSGKLVRIWDSNSCDSSSGYSTIESLHAVSVNR